MESGVYLMFLHEVPNETELATQYECRQRDEQKAEHE